jgi:pimeloyl-ACP methyl ester carboxylesterase
MKEFYDRNRAAAAKYTWQPRLYDPKLARWLHRINVPTHIIWGEGDFLIPPAHGEELQRLIPGASLTRMAGVGHLCDIEAPGAFAEAIVPFVAGLATQGGAA